MASDSAKGPLAGYLFQFEKALLVISRLENATDFVSIEDVDDVATHQEDGTVMMTYQAKNSISTSGTTFEDTSRALWRTFEIWIDKLEKGIFNNDTKFVCSTNKTILPSSLVSYIKTADFKNIVVRLNTLLIDQKQKLANISIDPTKGTSIKKTINSIKYVISKSSYFEIIAKNIEIEDNEIVKIKFFSELHLSDKYSETSKNSIYHEFYGWITQGSKAKWMNDKEARFTKKDFDDKLYHINSNSSLRNAIFRTKEILGSLSEKEIQKKRVDLFVKQIEDINRKKDAKERIIENAILDFLYCDIEIKHIVTQGDYTYEDFEKFQLNCKDAWQQCCDETILEDLENYNESQKNLLAINIFDTVMNKVEIKFKNEFEFNPDNRYIRNGSFLKLSNTPIIGWHPDWESKYKHE